MTTIRIAVAALVLAGAAAVLAGCTASGAPGTGPATSIAPTSSAGASGAATGGGEPTAGGGAVGPIEASVEAALREYQAAIAGGDFATACARNAPETSAQLIELVNAQGAAIATCEEAFALVFAQPGAFEAARESADTTTVDDVTVEGETAIISWTSQVQGEPSTVRNTLRAVDGQWLIVGTV